MREGLAIPSSNYPNSLDSWRELFRVYDSSQAVLANDLDPDDTEIEIIPRDPSRGLDIWGENGFISIEGEIIYYDSIEYQDYSPKYPISPLVHNGSTQEYYLSQCRRELTREIVHNPPLAGETPIGSPDMVVGNYLDNEPQYLDPSVVSAFYLTPPYSLMGRIRVGAQWYSFACKGSGGALRAGFDISPLLPGLTAIVLSKKGVTFYGSVQISLVELCYYSSPIRNEPLVQGSLNISVGQTQVVKTDKPVSTLLNSLTIDYSLGVITVYWNSNNKQDIQPEFKLSQVLKLKNCIRGEGATKVAHQRGRSVGGFVMAEHHNNLAGAVINLERWLGEDGTKDPDTIEYKLKTLEEMEVEKNPECPSGRLIFNILTQETRTSGPVVEFTLLSQSSTGNRIFFGDGTYEDNVGSVTHTYVRGSQFSPSAYFYNAQCEEYSTAAGGRQVFIPQVVLPTVPELAISPFEINLGEISFQIPDILFEPTTVPSFTGISIPNVIRIDPSIIRIIGPNIPSIIGFSDVRLPTWINLNYTGPTMIYFDSNINLPRMITITGLSIPTLISLQMLPIPAVIRLTGMPIPSQISVSISVAVDTSAISGNCFKLVPCTV